MKIFNHNTQLELPKSGHTLKMSIDNQKWLEMTLTTETVVTFCQDNRLINLPWTGNEDVAMKLLRAKSKKHREISHSRAFIDGEAVLTAKDPTIKIYRMIIF